MYLSTALVPVYDTLYKNGETLTSQCCNSMLCAMYPVHTLYWRKKPSVPVEASSLTTNISFSTQCTVYLNGKKDKLWCIFILTSHP